MYRRLLHNPNTNLFFYPLPENRGVFGNSRANLLATLPEGLAAATQKAQQMKKKYLESRYNRLIFGNDYRMLELCNKTSGDIR